MVMACIECKKESKYKCPVCRQHYCSVICYKEHKQRPCSAPPLVKDTATTQNHVTEYEYPTEDTVSHEKLKLLEKSKEIRHCLENPHLREILELLDKSPHPEDLIQDYMQEVLFTEFVDACLKVVQPQEQNRP